MIPTRMHPEDVFDLLYSTDQLGRVASAVDWYYYHIYDRPLTDRLKRALIRTWIKSYGIRVVRKAKRIIEQL